MKRTLMLVVVAAVVAALIVVGQTHAQTGTVQYGTVVYKGQCFLLPNYAPCPTPLPATIQPIFPVKDMTVGAPISGPAGVNSYDVNVVSQIGCFSLSEPVIVTALGNHGQAVLRQVNPEIIGGNPALVHVVPSDTGTALLSLEVWTSQVGPEGLTVKAIWPEENVERLQEVIPGQPVPTATGGPTDTPTPVPPTPAPPTSTPVIEGTPLPTATSTPSVPFSLQLCYRSNPSEIDIRSLPGAICTLALSLNQGLLQGTDYNSGPFSIPDTGVGSVPFTPSTKSTQGAAAARCTYGGQTLVQSISFAVTSG